jgi:hypothetical protein
MLIGIPSYGSPAEPFLASLAALTLPPGVGAIDHFVVTGNFVPAQRELIVGRALAAGVDVLLMCDDDMVLPGDAAVHLVEVLAARPRCALAGSLYYSRDGYKPMVVEDWDPRDTTTATIPAFDREPVAVAGIGFGCVALRMAAVQELEPPYFGAHVFVEQAAARVRVCNEDYLFCHRLRERGWDVVLHAGVRSGHYDRGRGVVVSGEQEPDAITSVRRVAIERNGQFALVPLDGEIHETAGEFHQPLSIEYVSMRNAR